ncbi:[FeFe] hydrogenase H-cluster radical SAM maturase HydE [Haliovirga abyssi]|uniref:[FeFe] hydrogenase H-cluster radical SAM maturase HydE n=1 Tax=Haliovirga abyssi TaxID=2996794 RepID=A0AAU9E480_9FUSO|nr:[FeFe] hydrogenase H-cluster radical SAM maturase HydE [Haliovirga abyssi]BDU51300.1 [FeFe] hydrogenase H-cluster radical SAM maturase HydE [Haliovirga abyssi]
MSSVSNEKELGRNEILSFMKEENEEKLKELYKKAYKIKLDNVGDKVYYRGIIEFSNICQKNCNYCGIRKSNSDVHRFTMSEEEILESAKWSYENSYGSLVLQSGERQDEEYIEFVTGLIEKIKKLSNGELGITLSLGEQTFETYEKWYNAGAHRYLLRIETSNKELYNKLHPADHKFETRINCLKDLKKIGYQVGTGVMIGLPEQTEEDLVDDILFFKDMDIDMIGMGPYIVSEKTPIGEIAQNSKEIKKKRFELGLKMIALTRIYLKDINIAATTALQALNPVGREAGLKAGANIIMPVITHKNYRKDYQLYDNKPCIDDNAVECKACLENRIKGVGDKIGYGEWGDSLHYKNKKKM